MISIAIEILVAVLVVMVYALMLVMEKDISYRRGYADAKRDAEKAGGNNASD